ncbi:unnamed protein product [Prorocentrum cordatum]|nr:unnamed protein product [Polarella glacialis]
MGYLYSAEMFLNAHPEVDLKRAWTAKAAEGVAHEIICEPTSGIPSMKLVDVPGKGLGFVAQRSIKPGEVVLVDTVFAVVNHTNDDDENLDMAEEIMRRSKLTESHRQCFEQKVDVLSCPSTRQSHFQTRAMSRGLPDHFARLANISEANAFSHRGDLAEKPTSLQMRPMPTSFALLPVGARFNHSCRPNALMRMGSDTAATVPGSQSRAVSGVAYWTAVRPIQAGEEVTGGYVPGRRILWQSGRRSWPLGASFAAARDATRRGGWIPTQQYPASAVKRTGSFKRTAICDWRILQSHPRQPMALARLATLSTTVPRCCSGTRRQKRSLLT